MTGAVSSLAHAIQHDAIGCRALAADEAPVSTCLLSCMSCFIIPIAMLESSIEVLKSIAPVTGPLAEDSEVARHLGLSEPILPAAEPP